VFPAVALTDRRGDTKVPSQGHNLHLRHVDATHTRCFNTIDPTSTSRIISLAYQLLASVREPHLYSICIDFLRDINIVAHKSGSSLWIG
jgi:hypothetical protein